MATLNGQVSYSMSYIIITFLKNTIPQLEKEGETIFLTISSKVVTQGRFSIYSKT